MMGSHCNLLGVEDPITVEEFGSEFDAVMRLRDALKHPHIK